MATQSDAVWRAAHQTTQSELMQNLRRAAWDEMIQARHDYLRGRRHISMFPTVKPDFEALVCRCNNLSQYCRCAYQPWIF
jgi:hypothetical protein